MMCCCVLCMIKWKVNVSIIVPFSSGAKPGAYRTWGRLQPAPGFSPALEFLHLVTASKYETWRTLQRAAPRLVSAPGAANSRRRLPHCYPPGKWLFLTWHLHDSLPHALYPPGHKLSDGRAFVWMDRYLDTSSYDHWVRDTRELERIVAYIEDNPVKVGLVARAEDYRWSSATAGEAAGAETSLGAAR